jgi:glycosyltransferase involved in cell wall biosynthesis
VNLARSESLGTQRISVVVPTYNRPDHLKRCLDSLTRVFYPDWELLIVDQSDDRSPQSLTLRFQNPNLTPKWLRASKGLSVARNMGLSRATGDILAFLDDDCTVESSWLQSVSDFFARRPDVPLVFGAVTAPVTLHDCFVPVYMPQRERVVHGRLGTLKVRGIGAAMYIRPRLLPTLRFDEQLGAGAVFPSCEDSDFGIASWPLGMG